VARAAGATTVIMVGRGGRLAVARELGCTATVDYELEDPVAGVRAAAGGRGVDCVFDCSGNPAIIGQLLRCARRGGTVALLGLAGGATAELPIDLVTLDELDVLGIRSSPNAYPAMIALLAWGTIRTEPLTTHVYPLSDVATAFDALARREAIRPIISL
jgi:L-iditol 2-dehydrogenase